jgi:hypothetical protein
MEQPRRLFSESVRNEGHFMLGFAHMSGDDSELSEEGCPGQILLQETNNFPSIAKGFVCLKDNEIPNYDSPQFGNVESIRS